MVLTCIVMQKGAVWQCLCEHCKKTVKTWQMFCFLCGRNEQQAQRFSEKVILFVPPARLLRKEQDGGAKIRRDAKGWRSSVCHGKRRKHPGSQRPANHQQPPHPAIRRSKPPRMNFIHSIEKVPIPAPCGEHRSRYFFMPLQAVSLAGMAPPLSTLPKRPRVVGRAGWPGHCGGAWALPLPFRAFRQQFSVSAPLSHVPYPLSVAIDFAIASLTLPISSSVVIASSA